MLHLRVHLLELEIWTFIKKNCLENGGLSIAVACFSLTYGHAYLATDLGYSFESR